MIEFCDVHKTYTSKRDTDVDALRGVSFKIESGEFVFIIGRSGSGKSTLMKCITREEVPEEGEVLIDGFDIASMSRALIPVLRRQIGMIYQDFRLIESKTVSENIAFAGEIVGIPRQNLNRIVQLVLSVVGLKDKADSYPQELSGGEQQRVAIARAMVNNPRIIVADEPTGDLDPETSESIMALLLDINKSGSTVIVCTHDSNLVDRMKKRVIELRDGRVIRDKKSSGYEDIPEEEPVASLDTLNVAFGDDPSFSDDADYSDSFDDDQYKAEESSLLLFGDDAGKDEEEEEAKEAASRMTGKPESESSEEEMSQEDPEAEEVQEVPEELSVSELKEESKNDEKEETSEDTENGSDIEEVPVFGDEVREDPASDKKEDPDTGDAFGKSISDEDDDDGDEWMKAASSGDEFIDLDIQEDDN